jgi:hypothetical protein
MAPNVGALSHQCSYQINDDFKSPEEIELGPALSLQALNGLEKVTNGENRPTRS